MKRYPVYDPPEYVDWSPDPELTSEFRERIDADPARRSLIGELEPARHLRIYQGLVLNRLHDIALKRWVRQGVISKAWLGTGEEAVTIGVVHALRPGDMVGPMIRNAGACHEMGMSVADMLRAYLATEDSPTGGRDIHLGDLDRGVVAPISMVGALVPVCAGLGLAFKIQRRENLALTWAGDGATRTTGFHEGLMCARALRLPLIVVVQDNQIALGTPVASHSRRPMEDLATIYGVPTYTCNGNHVLDVFTTTRLAAQLCREGRGPVLITARTFRMGGHATHDEGESRHILPAECFEHWGKRDPVGMYETYLAEADFTLSPGVSNREALERAEGEVIAEVEEAEKEALASREHHVPRRETQQLGVLMDVSDP
ncbi:MAG: thiamine pyrophosphate-dependent dehydrogenase E1 component subunit alpha [Acidobacteriota bacterium]